MITLLNINIVKIYNHVSKKKIVTQFFKKKNVYLNYCLNEQFYTKLTHHFYYKQRYNDNKQR